MALLLWATGAIAGPVETRARVVARDGLWFDVEVTGVNTSPFPAFLDLRVGDRLEPVSSPVVEVTTRGGDELQRLVLLEGTSRRIDVGGSSTVLLRAFCLDGWVVPAPPVGTPLRYEPSDLSAQTCTMAALRNPWFDSTTLIACQTTLEPR